MKEKMIAQCLLESGNQRLMAWLDASRVKEGWSVTLKDHAEPTRWWNILSVGIPMPDASVKKSHDSKAIWEKDYRKKVERLSVFT